MGNIHKTGQKLVIVILRGYQLVCSPFIGQYCRFYPTCSTYAIEAVEHFGIFKGVWLALRRLMHCHPWHPGGIDLVPPAGSLKE